jgi:hypothetical protein
LLKTSCCNATERKAIDANDSWACPACINLNKNEKESHIHFQKREIVEVSWNPTWESEELQNTCESFKQSLNAFEEHIAAPNLSQPAPDGHLNDLQKQGFSAIQEGNAYQPQNVDLRNKVSFDIQTTNPQADITATGHCEYWVTTIDISWIKKKLSSPDGTMLPEVYTDTVACNYNVDGSVKVCLIPSALTYYERPLTGQCAAVYTITLALHRNSLGLILVKTFKHTNKKIKDSFSRILPSHITAVFQKWALVTKEKMASPLDYDPTFFHYWSEHPRDKVFGANTNAFSSQFSGFSICNPIYHENTMLLATRHAIYFAAVSTEETATFMLLSSWNKNMTTIPMHHSAANTHTCVNPRAPSHQPNSNMRKCPSGKTYKYHFPNTPGN